MKNNQKILIGDCRKKLKEIKKETVSLAVTSPPYNIGKKYGKYDDNVSLNEWKELIKEVFILTHKCLKKNGSFFLNISPVPDKKTKEIIPLDAICYFIGKETGFYLRNSIIWHFNNMQNCSKRLSGRWEKILWFVKDIENYVFNLEDIRIPYITKNDKRLNPDGGRNPTDVWYFDRVNNMTKNKLNIADIPTMYPKQMIERILKMSSKKGDLILDPFVGSGTTLIVSEALGRRGVGIDIDKKYKNIIKKRFLNEIKT